jgi:DNA-binding PadR family transcriptional regulator
MTQVKPHHTGTLSPEMTLLGQLYGAPAHGYDLHRKVLADLGQVWHLSQSQAYSILHRLQAQGDVSAQEISQEKLPARQLLHITDKGRARFLEWLEALSGGSTRAIRIEFITRLYFLQQYFPQKIDQAFERQRADAQKHILRLEKFRAELSSEQSYSCLSLDLRLKQLTAVLEWLDESQKLFG